MTQADVADYELDTQQDEANAAITVGEVLTEQQMLQGLLVHSAMTSPTPWPCGTPVPSRPSLPR